ncbi:hypothetical protein PoB_003388000 [Plakobranchus ocellatus]|uniref:Secreted protein n=1 Tax=Plakobranchus ocellatus TaxID=259542 RepID=A0AAV4AGR5_9GAST|nr:hypothetical protein PoB_003388000 [Plakobranchus ocellatus]
MGVGLLYSCILASIKLTSAAPTCSLVGVGHRHQTWPDSDVCPQSSGQSSRSQPERPGEQHVTERLGGMSVHFDININDSVQCIALGFCCL